MKKAILYLHGKGGSACEVEQYAKNCPDFYLHGVDYQGSLPWLVQEQIVSDYRILRREYDSVILLANSIGAYFAMHTLQNCDIQKALLISPILDMEQLILDMMGWAKVSEQELAQKGRDSHRLWRNPFLEISLLCAGASHRLEGPHRDFIRRA